jgi:hypothetical protein
MVVRACEALDNLDQVLGFGQRVLLRPRQEMQGDAMGGFDNTGLWAGILRADMSARRPSPRLAPQNGQSRRDGRKEAKLIAPPFINLVAK